MREAQCRCGDLFLRADGSVWAGTLGHEVVCERCADIETIRCIAPADAMVREAVHAERVACAGRALAICESLRRTAVHRVGSGTPSEHRSARISNLRADVAWRVSEAILARGGR